MAAITGDSNDNVLDGTTSDDIIDGLGGNDTIHGGDGNDTISGGDGNDFIDGGAGVDVIDAGDGDDVVVYDAADGLSNYQGGNGIDTLLFNDGEWMEVDLAAYGFEFSAERYMFGNDTVTDKYDITHLLVESRYQYENGFYAITVFDPHDNETWSEWYREYDDQGTLILEEYIQDSGGTGSNTAPEDYAAVTEDLVLVTTGNIFADDTATNPVLDTVNGQPVALTGTTIITGIYGTLEIDAAGNYTYTLNNALVQSFTADDINPDVFAYEFTNDDGSFFTDLIVNITGNNDAPIATNNVAYVEKDSYLSDSGNVLTDDDGFGIDTDIEGQAMAVSQVGGTILSPSGTTVITGVYGTLTINGITGAYTYDLDNDNLNVQALETGETLIDTFTYAVTDASSFDTATLAVTIMGTASAPTTQSDLIATNEDDTVGVSDNVLSNDFGAQIYVSQINTTPVASSGDTIINGLYGTLTINAAGEFTYLVNSTDPAVQALRVSESLSETFTYTASNQVGSEIANLTVNISGMNDVAVVFGDDSAQVTEDAGAPPFDLGVLSITDPDSGEAEFAGGSYFGSYGTVQLIAQGSYTYTLNNSAAVIQSLPLGATLTDTVTIQTVDGTTHDISVVITGANDVAVITGVNTGATTEEDDPLTLNVSGALAVTDTDTGESFFTAQTVAGSVGSLTIDAGGNWTWSADNTQPAIQELGEGVTLTETITVTSLDGTPHNVVITITGVNDAAVIAGTDTGAVTEDADPATLTTTGMLTISDVDAGEAVFNASTTTGAYGSLTIDAAGQWTYSADNTQTAIQQLGAGSTLVDTITIQSIDGTTHDVSITINGTNDIAVIAGDDQGSVTEDATAPTITDSGTLTITDVDLNEAVFVAENLSGTWGGLTVDIAGNWSYAAFTDQQAIQELGTGDTLTETFTVQSVDGTAHDVTVVINGSNDAAEIGGVDAGGVTEDGGVLQQVSGVLTITDVDAGEAMFADGTVAGAHGSILLDAGGGWTYTLDNADPAVQALAQGATLNDVVTVYAEDGTAHDITITITGTNDVAVITGDDQAGVTEDVILPPTDPEAPPVTAIVDSGSLIITDTDTGEAAFIAATTAGIYGSLTINAAGNWTYSAQTAQLVIQQLATGETLTDTITVTTVDGTTHEVTATITGVNDGPTGVYDATGPVSNSADTLLLISNLMANDFDVEGDNFFFAGIEGQPIAPGGQVAVSHGVVTLSLDGSTLIFTPEAGYVGPTSFNYTLSDGETLGGGTVALDLIAQAGDDTLNILEDTQGTINVLANDGIVVDTVTAFVITSQPSNGSLVVNPDNTVTYTPDTNYNGPDQFTYEFTGMQTGLTYQFFDRSPNNSSVFNIPQGSETGAGVAHDFNVAALAMFYQGDRETFAVRYDGHVYVTTEGTYTFTTGSDDGSALLIGSQVVVNNDGLHSYQVRSGSIFLTAGYHDIEILYFERTGQEQLTVTMQGPDTGGLQVGLFASDMVGHSLRTDTATVNITVAPVNDAAIIGGTDTGTVNEDSGPATLVSTGSLTITDIDSPAQQAFVAGITGGSYGNLTIDAAGNWTYEALNDHPAINALVAGESLIDTFTVSSIDGTTHQVTITINGSDDAAIIGGVDTGTVTEDSGTGQVATGTLTVTDPDAGQSVFNLASATGSHGTFEMDAAGNWTYVLDNASPAVQALPAGATLEDQFTVSSLDGSTHVVTVTITGSNDLPVVTGDSTGTVAEDSDPLTLTVQGTLIVTDPDTGESGLLAGSFEGTYGAITTDAQGNWTYAADNTQAAIQQLGAGETLTDTISVTSFDGTAHDIPITINGTNDGPVAVADSLTASEDGPAATGNVITNDTDIESDTLTVSAIEGSAALVGQQLEFTDSGALLTLNADGSYSYDANGQFEFVGAGETAIDTFEYTVSDGNGGSSTATVSVTVQGANDAATFSGDDTGAVTEDAAPSEITATGTLVVNDIDQNQSSMTAAIVTGAYGTLTIDAAGAWTYTADNTQTAIQQLGAGETLTDTISVASFDGTPHDITITINGVNDAPVATLESPISYVSEDAGDTFIGNLFAMYGFVDPDGDNLSITAIDGTAFTYGQPVTLTNGGTITVQANGDFSFNPNGDFEYLRNTYQQDQGFSSFNFTVSDGNGGSIEGYAAVGINGENDAATIIGPLTGSVTEDTIEGPGIGVPEFDNNPNVVNFVTVIDADQTEDHLFVVGQNNPLLGSYGEMITPGSWWGYSLNNDDLAVQALGVGETLTDTITIQSFDGTPFDVTITIHGTNDGPVAVADVLTVGEDDSVTTGNLITNDTDIDGDTLAVSAVNGIGASVDNQVAIASGALVSVNSDGSYSYAANDAFDYLGAGETAIDTFEYTVSDGNDGVDTATVSVTVNGVNDAAMVIGDDSGLGLAGSGETPIDITGTLTVEDPDQNQSSFLDGIIGGSYGNLTIGAAGNWSYTALSNHPAIVALGVGETLTDVIIVSTLDGTTHQITITLSGGNDAPLAVNNTASMSEADAVAQTGNVILDDDGFGADSDPDGNDLTVSAVAGTSVPGTGTAVIAGLYGTLTIAADGSYSYLFDTENPFVAGMATGDTLTDTFSYTITDGLETSAADLGIVINGISEADQQLEGDEGSNVIHAAGGNDLVDAYGSDDIIYGHGGNDGLNGGAGNDIIYGGAGLDFIYGDTGSDHLYGGDDTDAIFAGDDDDFVWGEGGGDNLDGGFGNDELHGGDGVDWLYGSFGDDVLYGDADGDALFGQEGQDTLYGGTGGDSLDGGAGNDLMYGGDGVDWMFGGADNDIMYGGADTDAMFGEAGNDTLYGGDGGDSLDGGIGDDSLFGEDGVDWLFGGDGSDLLVGGGDTDVLFGGAGNDWLQGGDIGDSLDGGAGDDVLDGGEGVDVLYGDTGADIFFVFNAAQGGDVIRDFFTGEDKLYVDPLGMGLDASYSGQISASMFSSGEGLPAELASGPQFYLETGGQGLWFDPTGGGTGDMFIVAGFETGVPQWSDIHFNNPWLA